MKSTRLQALHSFVIYLKASLAQIVSSTPSWLVRGGCIDQFSTAVDRVNRRCTELLAHKTIVVVGRSFAVNSCVVDEIIRESTESFTCYRARLTNFEHFETLHLSGRKQTIHTQLLVELFKSINNDDVFFCNETARIRPTEDDVSVNDVIYKVILSDRVRVQVIFYTVAELECVCSSGSGHDSASEDQANAFLRSLLRDDIIARAAAFAPELQQGIKHRERSEYVKKFAAALEQSTHESHTSPIDICAFLGETLTYTPCMDNAPNLLKAHILKAKSFINNCLLKKNAMWSIVKEIVLEVPSKSEQMKGMMYVNLSLPDESDAENQSNAIRLMDSTNTIIYTCDERKMDGEFRRLFKRTSFIKQLSIHSNLHKLYLIVVSSSQLVMTQDRTNLRKQLCEAKQMELHSMLKHASKDDLSRVTIACVIGGVHQIRQEISEIFAGLNARNHMYQTTLKCRIHKLEEIISQVCDDLHALATTCIQSETLKEDHHTFFASQHAASLTAARLMNTTSSLGRVHFDTVIRSWRRRWLIMLMQTASSAIFQYLKSCGDVQIGSSSTSYTILEKLNSSHFDATSRKRRKQERFPPFRRSEVLMNNFMANTHSSLSNHLDFRTTATILKNLNKKMILEVQTGFLRKVPFLGIHTLSTISIKRSLWAFGRRCERHFIQLMAPEKLECMIKTLFSQSLYDYLLAQWHVTVKPGGKRNHILDDIICDIQTIIMSKLVTIMECYCIESEHVFGLGGVVCCVQNGILHEKLKQNMEFPLYEKLDDKFTWYTNYTDRFCTKHVNIGNCYPGFIKSTCMTSGTSVSVKLNESGTICHLSRVIIEAMSFIERESVQRTEFFAVWGSDLLATFYFFREISHIDSLIWQVTNNILRRLALMWLEKNANINTIASIEDFLFYNEGHYVLSRVGMQNMRLGSMIHQRALEWDTELSEYLGLNSGTRLIPDDCSFKKICFDKLSTAMIWSFFLRGNQLNISGTSAEEIDALCRSVDLSKTTFTTAKQFRDVCYCITHRIFTKSSWCQFPLAVCEWKTETKFLRFYLPCLVQAADVELVGEFIQALRCVGVSELEHDMLTASTFLLNSRNTNTGGWLDESTAFETQYHATVCSIGALMKHSYHLR